MIVFIHPDGYQRGIGFDELDTYVTDCDVVLTRSNGSQATYEITCNGKELGTISVMVHSEAATQLAAAHSRTIRRQAQ